jgi:hypothetical protein
VCHRTVSGGWINSNLLASGIWGSRSAKIHRTVRCNIGLSGVPAEQRLLRANGLLQGTVKANSACLRAQKSEQAPEGAPDSEQDLSDAPPNCPVAPLVRAPTVGIQRPGDVVGAPDSVRCAIRQKPSPTAILVVGAINTPQPPHFKHPSFSHLHSIQEL